jgi:hypothetical protein
VERIRLWPQEVIQYDPFYPFYPWGGGWPYGPYDPYYFGPRYRSPYGWWW